MRNRIIKWTEKYDDRREMIDIVIEIKKNCEKCND